MDNTEQMPRQRGKKLQYWQNVIRSDENLSLIHISMSVGRMAEIFARIAKWHPDAPVTMDGKSIAAVMLSSLFDSAADAEVQVFLMEG